MPSRGRSFQGNPASRAFYCSSWSCRITVFIFLLIGMDFGDALDVGVDAGAQTLHISRHRELPLLETLLHGFGFFKRGGVFAFIELQIELPLEIVDRPAFQAQIEVF